MDIYFYYVKTKQLKEELKAIAKARYAALYK